MLLGLDGKPLVVPLLWSTIASIQKVVRQDSWDEDLPKIWLWVLVLCESAEVFEVNERQAWAMEEMILLIDTLSLDEWAAVEEILLGFPWARCLHEPAAASLWSRARSAPSPGAKGGIEGQL